MATTPRGDLPPTTADLERYAAIETELLGRWPETRIAPDLSRIAHLLSLLGEPQNAYPVLHVAGTNGKTSTVRMAESLLRALGLRTGMFTSPHLQSMRERVQLAGRPVTVPQFVAAFHDVAPYLALADSWSIDSGGPRLSFFEAMTALGYALFADAPVDAAVVETGLGGTWDATNVADGRVAVIMPVALDHQRYLGDTVEQIAGEKAGIIKAGSHVVLAQQTQPAAEVLLRRVAEVAADVVRDGIDFGVLRREVAVGGQQLTLQGLGGVYDSIFLPLFGAHQAHNAAVALAAVESFVGGGTVQLDADVVREGFAGVLSPGRLEVVRGGPTILVDAAHNPHGAHALVSAVQDGFDFTHLVGVVAVMADKEAYEILQELEPLLAEVVITSNSSPRAVDADELGAVAVDVFGDARVQVVPDLARALEVAVALADDAAARLGGGTGVLVTGSVVTAGDARGLLVPAEAAP